MDMRAVVPWAVTAVLMIAGAGCKERDYRRRAGAGPKQAKTTAAATPAPRRSYRDNPPANAYAALERTRNKLQAWGVERDKLARQAAPTNPQVGGLLEARTKAWQEKRQTLDPMIAANSAEGAETIARGVELKKREDALGEQLKALPPDAAQQRETLMAERAKVSKELREVNAKTWDLEGALVKTNPVAAAAADGALAKVNEANQRLDQTLESSGVPGAKALIAEGRFLRGEIAFLEQLREQRAKEREKAQLPAATAAAPAGK